MQQNFNEDVFKRRVTAALEKVKTILDNSRQPQFPADLPHKYDDKYLLAEFVASNTLSSIMHVLTTLGVSEKHLSQMKEWSKKRSVSLRLHAEENCKFIRKTTRDVESDTKSVNKSTLFGKSESFTVTKIHEWFWAFDFNYELIAFMGNEPDKPLVLQGRKGAYEIKTTSETTPKPINVQRSPLDLNISWLLTNIEESGKPRFSIDRAAKSCHTPRRNAQVDDAFTFMVNLYRWGDSVQRYFRNDVFPTQSDHGIDLKTVAEAGVFVPVLPVFEKPRKEKKDKKEKRDKKEKKSKKNLIPGASAGAVPADLSAPFQSEQARSVSERFAALTTVFPANDKLVTVAEAKLMVLTMHLMAVASAYAESVGYIEDMLRKQLIAAIGKEVQPRDFSDYLRFHNRKLFRPEYQPRPFCYAVRRPAHVPEGTLTIEQQMDGATLGDPIYTNVCYAPAKKPMKFALSAASNVSFMGDRYLHAWVSHQFSGVSPGSLTMIGRARQFSSYILMVGSIAGADLFMPKYGLIIQNKDEFKIPLDLATIPTPKEFKDAISSLSPEQQRFAKGFRSMQLESTLFGVCVIQIKPQLEKLLKLNDDGLTKEIALTQELLNLFIEYQIPSDLLSYDGPENASSAAKVAKVKEYVANMRQTIQKSSQAQLEIAQEQQKFRIAEFDRASSGEEEDNDEGAITFDEPAYVPMKYSKPLFDSKSFKKKDEEATENRKPVVAKLASPANLTPTAPITTEGGAAALTEQPKKQAGKAEELIEEPLPAGDLAADLTKVPQQLEKKYEALDPDSALRPTIISVGQHWTKVTKAALLSPPVTSGMAVEEQGKARDKCFDLLDALTKSGALTIDHAALHVVIAATHCFDKTLMNTVIQDNVNPIEKLERSSLIVASTIQNRTPAALIAPEHLERVGLYSPMLLQDADSDYEDAAPAASPKALPVLVTKQ